MPAWSTCPRATWHANFSFWHADLPKGMPNFQTYLLQNAKGNFYTLLLYKKFYVKLNLIVYYVLFIKIVLYFISILNVILKKSFGFWKCWSLVKNESAKRPSFYTWLVTRVFLNFPQLKQLKKIKNTWKYCDLKLQTAWIGDPR